MRKSNINVLLVALTSAVALAACGSGSSSPAPTPTPVPTPTPSPTPTPVPPTPTPTPVPGESGVYALAGSGINVTYSTTPSTNAWTNFTSGTTQPFVAGVASESAALLLSTDTNTGNPLAVNEVVTLNYGLYATTGAQVASKLTSIPVTVTNTVAIANASTVTLPTIPATQIASNGSNAVVVVPSAATSVGNAAVQVVAAANSGTYNLYTISASGIATELTGYYNLSGNYVALPTASVQTNAAVFFINGMYYAYNVTANNQLLQSSDGVTWQQITNNTVLGTTGTPASNLANVVQVSGSVFAAIDNLGGLYLGSSPANLIFQPMTIPTNPFVDPLAGFIAANGTGVLYTYADANHIGNLATYTPTAATLGSATAASTSAPVVNSLVFAGSNIYSANATTGNLSAITISGPAITQAATPASTITATGTIGSAIVAQNGLGAAANRFLAMGSKVLVLNTDSQNLGGFGAGEIASISAVAANGVATYNNLPSGVNVVPAGFAGTTNGYMLALSNGNVLVSSANGFVQASTVLNPNNGNGTVLKNLVSANGTYLAVDNILPSLQNGNNLYFSDDNGTSWTTIPVADFPVAPDFGTQVNIQSAGGLYFISYNSAPVNVIYQTATPQILSSWVQVSGIPNQARTSYWGGTYYVLNNASNDVGVYNPSTGQTVINLDVLPQNASTINGLNVSYSGSTYALAQVGSNYLWTSASLIGGVSGWGQNSVAFTGVNGVALTSEQFFGPLTWTGKVWVATGKAPSFNIYTATEPTTFAVGTYTNTQGLVTAVNGIIAGLF